MTTESFRAMQPFRVKALVAIHGKHPTPSPVAFKGQIDCPRCRGRLTYTLHPDRRAEGACTSASCISFKE